VCPMVVTVHGWYERLHWRSLFPTVKGKLWYWKNEVAHYWNADAVLTVSDTARNRLIEAGVAPGKRIISIPLAPDETFTEEYSESDAAILDRYGLREPYLLNVGGYDPWKNVGPLVHAFERSSLKEHLLVICGRHTAHYLDSVPQWQSLKRFRDIRFLEPVSQDLPAIYRHASFLAHPSLCESFGLPVVEAMASGCPVACSSEPSLPETVGDAAVLFDPLDLSAISAALDRLGSDAALRDRLRCKGFQNVKRFSWQKTAEATMKVYKSLQGTGASQ
jgi:glycosyltransferase involved in cell wall biosynthesis